MITMPKPVVAAIVAMLAASVYVQVAAADVDASRGEAIGAGCLACHGIEDFRNADPPYRVPKLGGQAATYLVNALQGYRNGARSHPIMSAQAKSLTEQQIEDVAAYLAGLGSVAVTAGGSDGSAPAAARTCAACHGQNGISLSPTWPTLAGQHEDYLVYALEQYRDGKRKNGVMMPVGGMLSDADIEVLARYYAGLEGLETTTKD